MNPVQNFSPYFPNIHSNIIFSSTPRPSTWSLLLRLKGKGKGKVVSVF
jgi:hypothetical protein